MALITEDQYLVRAKQNPNNAEYSDDDIRAYYQRVHANPISVPETTDYSEKGDFMAGMSAGWEGQKAIGNNAAAAVSQLLDDTEGRTESLANAELNNAEAAKASAGRVSQWEQIDGLGSAIDYAQFTLGQLVPSAGVSLAGGGVVGTGFKLAATKLIGLTAKGATKKLTETYVKQGVTRDIAQKTAEVQSKDYVKHVLANRSGKIAATKAGEKFAPTKYADELVEKAFNTQATKLGGYIGVATVGYGTGVGDLYGTSVEAGEFSTIKSLFGAVPYAAADTLVGGVLLGGVGAKLAKQTGDQVLGKLGVKSRVAASVVNPLTTGAVVGGVSEAIQEELNIQIRASEDSTFDPTGEQAWSQRTNAALAGALGGKAAGLPSSVQNSLSKPAAVQEAEVVNQALTDLGKKNLREGRIVPMREMQEALAIKAQTEQVIAANEAIVKEQEAADKEADDTVLDITKNLEGQTKAQRRAEAKAAKIIAKNEKVKQKIKTKADKQAAVEQAIAVKAEAKKQAAIEKRRAALNTTPVINTPIDTPVINTPIDTPVINTPIDTPVINTPIDTPVINTPIDTPVINNVAGLDIANRVESLPDTALNAVESPVLPTQTGSGLESNPSVVGTGSLNSNLETDNEVVNDQSTTAIETGTAPVNPTEQRAVERVEAVSEIAQTKEVKVKNKAQVKKFLNSILAPLKTKSLYVKKSKDNKTPIQKAIEIITPTLDVNSETNLVVPKDLAIEISKRKGKFGVVIGDADWVATDKVTTLAIEKIIAAPQYLKMKGAQAEVVVETEVEAQAVVEAQAEAVVEAQAEVEVEVAAETVITKDEDNAQSKQEKTSQEKTSQEKNVLDDARAEANDVVTELTDDFKYSKADGVVGLTTDEAILELRKDKFLSNLLDSNKLVIQSVDNSNRSDTDTVFVEGETVQGQYQNGTATVFAENNTTESLTATAYHEVFHAAVDTLSPEVRADLLDRLGKLSVDKKAQWVIDAAAVIPESTSDTNFNEELGAYAITQHTVEGNNLPAGVVKWVKDLIAKIKASIYKNTGVLLGSLNPATLNALAKGFTGKDAVVSGELKLSVMDDVKKSRPIAAINNYINGAYAPVDEGNLGLPAETRKGWLQRQAQDNFNRVGQLVKFVEANKGEDLSHDANPYKVEELATSLITNEQKYLKSEFLLPVLEDMQKFGISLEQLDSFLIARHAEERNIHISTINADMQDGGSGILTADAKKVLAEAEASPQYEGLVILADRVYALNDRNITMMEDGGLISTNDAMNMRSPDVANSNKLGYKYYVPLKGKLGVSDSPGAGTGYNIGSNGLIAAKGRGEGNVAESPLNHSFAAADQTSIRAGKSEVGRAMVKMVVENPDLNLYSMTETSYQTYVDTKTGQSFDGFLESEAPDNLILNSNVKRVIVARPKSMEAELDVNGKPKTDMVVLRVDPNYKSDDNVFTTMVDGSIVQVEFKDALVAAQLKKLNAPQMNVVVQSLGSIGRYIAAINTSLNPEFVVTNMMRDVQVAFANIVSEQEAKGMAIQVVKDVPKAIKGIFDYLWNGNLDSEWSKEYQEMEAEGGTIGFYGLEDVDSRVRDMHKLLNSQGTAAGKARLMVDKVAERLSIANASVENAVRLTAYVAAKKQGKTKKQAASLAKNLTVNFNKKGEMAPVLNAMFVFFNASAQGLKRSGEAMLTKKGKKLVAGLMAISFTLAVFNEAAGGEDEEGVSYYSKIPDYEKSFNWIFMIPGTEGEYVKIKLPYVWNIPSVVGAALYDVAAGNRSTLDAASHIAITSMNSASPIQGANFIDFITPTAIKPLVQSQGNFNYRGDVVVPEYKFDDYDRPDSDRSFTSTSQNLKDVMKGINSLTGGDDTTSGLIDVSPETIKHYFGWVTGGAGQTMSRSIGTATTILSGELPETRDVPFLRTVKGTTSHHYDSDQYYGAISSINGITKQLKRYKTERSDNRISYQRNNSNVLRLKEALKNSKKKMKTFRKLRTQAKLNGNDELYETYNDRIQKEQRSFNLKFRRAIERDDK